jgi:predicted chitinase
MSYAESLNNDQKNNIALIKGAMESGGITNPYSQAALLAIVSKESSFYPKRENMNYSAKRIREVWPSISVDLSNKLANKPADLANYVYVQKPIGYRNDGYGNVNKTDGWNYRGGGYNQLTFKGSYDKYGKRLGIPLGTNPSLIEKPDVSAKVVVAFMNDRFKQLKDNGKLASYGGAKNINDFKDLENATMAFYHANSGSAKSVSKIKNLAKNDSLGGMKKALSRVPSLYDLARKTLGVVKKNPLPTAAAVAILIVGMYLLIKNLKK